jgi:membrane fusion protein, multidrug efflux system
LALFAFLRRHFFFALAGAALLAMACFVLLKEIGIVGGNASADKTKAAAGAGADKSKDQSKGKGDSKGGAGARPANVTLASADVRTFSDRVEVPGTAMANESIVVTSKVQDIVEQVLFESGQYVQRGAVLVVLSRAEQSADVGGAQRDIDAAFDDADGVLEEAAAARADADAAYNEINAVSRDLEAARASISEALAVQTEARLNLNRVTTLSDRGYASKARLDGARAQLQTADARVLVARERAAGASQRITTQQKRASALTSRAQSVEQRAGSARSRAQAVSQRANSVQSRLADRTIRAPFSGRLGLRTISPGQLARPGEPLVTLDDISQIKIDFDVPESRMGSVQVGTEIVVRSAAVPDQLNRAIVRFIDTRIDPRSRTVRARAYVPNDNGLLRPGMLMSVDILSPGRSRPAVPEVALLEEGNESFVFVADGVAGSDGSGLKAKKTPVTIGARREGFVEILGGIPVGAPVIVEGLVRLRDGQAIKPMGGPSAPAAPPTPTPAPTSATAKEQGAR